MARTGRARWALALLACSAVLATGCVQPAATADDPSAIVVATPSPSPSSLWPASTFGHTMLGAPGEQVATITVPRLNLANFPVRMGTTDDILLTGVGVYTGAATPGSGNFATAGHRVTPVLGVWHGPYYDLDRLVEGDYAWILFEGRAYEYRWRETIVTRPDDVSVLADGRADLTMTACHPKGEISERIVAFWDLVGSAPITEAALALSPSPVPYVARPAPSPTPSPTPSPSPSPIRTSIKGGAGVDLGGGSSTTTAPTTTTTVTTTPPPTTTAPVSASP